MKPPPPAPAIACPESMPETLAVYVNSLTHERRQQTQINQVEVFGFKLSFIVLVVSNLMLSKQADSYRIGNKSEEIIIKTF